MTPRSARVVILLARAANFSVLTDSTPWRASGEMVQMMAMRALPDSDDCRSLCAQNHW